MPNVEPQAERKKRGRGRPPRGEAALSVRLSVKMTTADALRLMAVAKHEKVNVGALIRALVLDGLTRVEMGPG